MNKRGAKFLKKLNMNENEVSVMKERAVSGLKHKTTTLPETGFLRLNQIIGDETNPAIIPVGRSSFLQGVREGRFPRPIKLGKRTTAWRVSDIRALINGVGAQDEGGAK